MNNENEHLETLTEIRSLMERSTKFISLSGLSGVCAGIFALLGAYAAHDYLNNTSTVILDDLYYTNTFLFFILDASLVLGLSLIGGVAFTYRKAKKNNQLLWDATSKRLLINLLIPLVTGGLFCLILLYHNLVILIAPTMLLFYGLALINASKYTLHDIRHLGICELILGLIASVFVGYGLLFWAIGFGVFHIIYGSIMYFKYEQ
jgi:hypothetical protein